MSDLNLQLWRFLNGEMSDDETRQFSHELSQNDELLTSVSEEIVKHYGRLELKKKLKIIQQHLEEDQVKKVRVPLWRAAAVALIIALPLAGLFIWNPNRQLAEELIAPVFEPYNLGSMTDIVSDDTLDNKDWTQASLYYKNEEYEKAIPILEHLSDTPEDEHFVYDFYLGLCYLGKEPPSPAEAIPPFQRVTVDPSHSLYEQAHWYLGLAYYKNEEMDKALEIFQSISQNPQAFNYKEAIDIINSRNK